MHDKGLLYSLLSFDRAAPIRDIIHGNAYASANGNANPYPQG